jgi:N-acetylglutamate synthase-like GNAT family acetyltransferase
LREGVVFFVTHYEGSFAGCGGIKMFGAEYGEVKRMFVRPVFRGKGTRKGDAESFG